MPKKPTKTTEEEKLKLEENFQKELSDDRYPNEEFTSQELTVHFSDAKLKQSDKKFIKRLNEIMNSDFTMLQAFRENFLNFTEALQGLNVSLDAYVDAVRYVSYTVNGLSNHKAYMRTFPERYKRLVDEGFTADKISCYVNGYNKGKLVTRIYEQARIPTYILNADVYQEAVNVQANIMRTAKSEKVKSDAANSLLTHLKAPERTKIEMDIGIKQDSSVIEMRESLRKLAETQKTLIENGITTGSVAASKIIEHSEIEDVEISETNR